jgi:uncharacterized LabA/DUF88 family protein
VTKSKKSKKPEAYVYVDGFNLYNGLKRRAKAKGVPATEYRWLDLICLARILLPQARVTHVFYFTSRVKRRLDNPDAADRQEIFLRALDRVEQLTIVEGRFQRTRVRGEIVGDPEKRLVTVHSYKEKRSDVNLAAQLIEDAYERKCKLAAVVSGDSDLVRPVEIAARKLPFGVVVLNPNTQPCGDFNGRTGVRQQVIPEDALRKSTLPIAVADKEGRVIRRPEGW